MYRGSRLGCFSPTSSCPHAWWKPLLIVACAYLAVTFGAGTWVRAAPGRPRRRKQSVGLFVQPPRANSAKGQGPSGPRGPANSTKCVAGPLGPRTRPCQSACRLSSGPASTTWETGGRACAHREPVTRDPAQQRGRHPQVAAPGSGHHQDRRRSLPVSPRPSSCPATTAPT